MPNSTTTSKAKSPPVAIKRLGSYNGHWQDYIDREQSSMGHLIKESFEEYCKNLEGTRQESPLSDGNDKFSSLGRKSAARATSSKDHCLSLPRRSTPKRQGAGSTALPPGIEELETLYAPMRNLMQPLPNARKYSGNTMPELHPLHDLSSIENKPERDDDLESEACSVIMPPPLAPVQSHAILEESLGPIPRTPIRPKKFISNMSWSNTPPLPPKRTSSILLQRPKNLSLSSTISSDPHASSPSGSGGIYANLHRSSLMSTGSSENSSDSSLPSFEPDSSITPATPSSEKETFSWPNYAVGWSPVPSSASEEHRSVSQIGEHPDISDCSSSGVTSNVYVKMNPVFKENHYMNVLYNAVQDQGGSGSVEGAMTPYISMNVRKLPNSNVDSIAAIYAQPSEILRRKRKDSGASSGSRRLRSSSTSRIQEMKNKTRKKLTSSSSVSSEKARALADFKDLMQQVEQKRQFRVGLNIFNSKPDLGIDYLVQRGFIELSPLAVGKFLLLTQGLSKDKIGEYLGELQNPFAMKVLSCFMQEFNFQGQRIDKSIRKLLKKVRVPGEAQKIEQIMDVFAKRYSACNPTFSNKLKSADSVVTLAFATMLLNTDLHSPNLKENKKMSLDDFVNNLKGVDGGKDFDFKLLKSIYKSIKKQEFVGGSDHVLQTQVIQQSIVHSSGKHPNLAEHHRRLVCLCRLSEVVDINSKKEVDASSHVRDVFLFNDILVISKQSSKSTKTSPVYSLRENIELQGLEVTLFHTPIYKFGIQLSRKRDDKVLVTLNAGSESDRYKFVMDLQESIFEMDQMTQVMREIST